MTCKSPVASLTHGQSTDTQEGRGDGGLWGEELVSGLQWSPQARDPPENTSEESRSLASACRQPGSLHKLK